MSTAQARSASRPCVTASNPVLLFWLCPLLLATGGRMHAKVDGRGVLGDRARSGRAAPPSSTARSLRGVRGLHGASPGAPPRVRRGRHSKMRER